MKKIIIHQIDISSNKGKQKTDIIAEDISLQIFINQRYHTTLLCSPEKLRELVIGHLLSEGILRNVSDVAEFKIEDNGKCFVNLNKKVGSPAVPSKVSSSLTVEARVISESVSKLNLLAEIFRKTGGTHIAALYSREGRPVVFAEDVGRYNAVDRVIGAGALSNVDFGETFLALSGRINGKMVFKAARLGIPLVASISAALNSGVDTAREVGITLIGFVRDKTMNVYTYPERIVDIKYEALG